MPSKEGAGEGVDTVAALVRTIQGSDDPGTREAAFGELVLRFQDMAFGCAYAALGDPEAARDAAQEAFVTAWRFLDRLRRAEAFPAWFRRIVTSEAGRIRRTRRAEEPLDAEPRTTRGPEDAAEAADRRARVRRALDALPPHERVAVLLYYIGGYAVGEVAAFLHVPPSTVKNRLHTARSRLPKGELRLAQDELRSHHPSEDPRFAEAVDARLFAFRTDLSYYEERAEGLLKAQRAQLAPALRVIARFHPCFQGRGPSEVAAAPFSVADARLVVGRQHGFESWFAFAAHIADLAGGRCGGPFPTAFQAIEASDAQALRACLETHPSLVRARGTNGNSLLHLAAGARALPCALALLERGAHPDLANDRGASPLHQAGYGNQPELAAALLAAGARPDGSAYGEGGTPLAWALFWGHREVTAVLAAAAAVPLNLRVAAGLGRVDLLDSLCSPGGTLAAKAGAHRGFYRPHTGFPDWTPSDKPAHVQVWPQGQIQRHSCVVSIR